MGQLSQRIGGLWANYHSAEEDFALTNTAQRKNLPIWADYHSAEENFALTNTAQKKTLRGLSQSRVLTNRVQRTALNITAQRRTLR